MRKLLGGAVAALSVGALGFYANNNHAERMQTNVTAGAEQVAVSSVHGVTTSVSGRDITVSGLAHSESERDTLVTALQKVDGRRVVIDELTVLATASPYEMFSTKTADGRTFGGVTPNETARAYVGEAMGSENAAGLELAAGMPDERWPEVGNAGLAALDILETGTMTLSDRKLTVMGTARTPVEVAAAENFLATLPEGYEKDVQFTSLLPTASPYELHSSKDMNGQSYGGSIPDEATRNGLVGAMGAEGAAQLGLAWGMPDGVWPSVANKGLAVMDTLETGEMALVDRTLTVTGTASTPTEKAAAEAVLENLPDGYEKVVSIDTLDDGKPVSYAVTYTEAGGPVVAGKLPNGATPASIAAALGVGDVNGSAVTSAVGGTEGADKLHADLAALAGNIQDMRTFSYAVSDTSQSFFSKLQPGVDGDLIEAQLGRALGENFRLVFKAQPIPEPEPTPEPEAELEIAPEVVYQEGDLRYNGVTRNQEIYMGGFWMTVLDFQATSENCAASAKEVLESAKINFITSSAELDPSSWRALSNLGAVILSCLGNSQLRVEVGGHTDSDGSDVDNYILSKARAEVVVQRLLARGVPVGRIIAVGFGDTEPVADNATEEGKAANRRTAIRWFELTE